MSFFKEFITDEKAEQLMKILDTDYEDSADITEAIIKRLVSLELKMLQLEGYLAVLERTYALSRKI